MPKKILSIKHVKIPINILTNETDTKGRKLKVHKLCVPKVDVTLGEIFRIDFVEGTISRVEGESCIAAYMIS